MFHFTGDCKSYENHCLDGSCYHSDFKCDSWVDCPAGEDDIGCGGMYYFNIFHVFSVSQTFENKCLYALSFILTFVLFLALKNATSQ